MRSEVSGCTNLRSIVAQPGISATSPRQDRWLAVLGLTVCFALVGCAQYATVREVRPRFPPVATTAAASVKAEQMLTRAARTERSKPLDALGEYLRAAEDAADRLARNPSDEQARLVYNFAVARVFTTIERGRLDPWSRPLRVPAEGGDFLLTHRPPRFPAANPAYYTLTPSDQFDISGTYVKERTVKRGLGAPLVAVSKELRTDAAREFAAPKTFYGVTALVRFEQRPVASSLRRATIAFEDPLGHETTSLGGRSFPLAGDFTVPLAVMLAKENPKKLELARALQPEKYAETARIVRLQPYDPNKTVVIVTHGLMDSPATWTPMLNALRGDPFIRQNYQFWFFSYPSGYAYPYSAMILRRELDAIEQRFPLRKPVVLIGHSMGSMISRLMITDTGDTVWRAMFGKAPAETRLSPKARAMLEETLIFRSRPEVGRVIFISGPHRGSDMATNWIGRFGASLIKTPATLAELGREMRQALREDDAALHLNRLPTSVDTLAPNNRFVKAVSTIPIKPGVPYHSIIGDRGKGGNKDQTPPVSSDGVVPYWSSHLDGAQSELIIPSNHSAHQRPEATAEVRRILHEHIHIPRTVSSLLKKHAVSR